MKTFIGRHKEIFLYMFWGIMTTVVSWGTYSVFVLLLKSIVAANIISWICAVLFAFVTNKLLVFGSADWSASVALPELWKFIAARLATGLLEMAGVPLLVSAGVNQRILGVDGMVSKVLVSVAVVVLNYVLSRLVVFKNRVPDSQK